MAYDQELIKRLGLLGFKLFEGEDAVDANKALADIVRSRDQRLLEGIPVVLANACEKSGFDHSKATSYLAKREDKECLGSFLAMSLALYDALGVKYGWSNNLFKTLNSRNKQDCRRFLESIKKDREIKLCGYEFTPERLIKTFNNYFSRIENGLNELLKEKEELGLEYAMSQILSPGQKEIFLKKIKGDKLSKTEREYFSRVVKKKIMALANTKLHLLAQKLLE